MLQQHAPVVTEDRRVMAKGDVGNEHLDEDFVVGAWGRKVADGGKDSLTLPFSCGVGFLCGIWRVEGVEVWAVHVIDLQHRKALRPGGEGNLCVFQQGRWDSRRSGGHSRGRVPVKGGVGCLG